MGTRCYLGRSSPRRSARVRRPSSRAAEISLVTSRRASTSWRPRGRPAVPPRPALGVAPDAPAASFAAEPAGACAAPAARSRWLRRRAGPVRGPGPACEAALGRCAAADRCRRQAACEARLGLRSCWTRGGGRWYPERSRYTVARGSKTPDAAGAVGRPNRPRPDPRRPPRALEHHRGGKARRPRRTARQTPGRSPVTASRPARTRPRRRPAGPRPAAPRRSPAPRRPRCAAPPGAGRGESRRGGGATPSATGRGSPRLLRGPPRRPRRPHWPAPRQARHHSRFLSLADPAPGQQDTRTPIGTRRTPASG